MGNGAVVNGTAISVEIIALTRGLASCPSLGTIRKGHKLCRSLPDSLFAFQTFRLIRKVDSTLPSGQYLQFSWKLISFGSEECQSFARIATRRSGSQERNIHTTRIVDLADAT